MVVSLTATPMMCSRLLKVKHNHGRLYNWSEKFFQWIISTYASALQVVLNHPALTMLVMALTIGVNVYLYVKIPKGFFPQQDTGRLQGRSRASSTSLSGAGRRRLSGSKSRSAPIRMSIRSMHSPAAAAAAWTRRRQLRADVLQLKPHRRTHSHRRSGDRPYPPQDVRHARRDSVPAVRSRISASAAGRRTRSISTRCRRRISLFSPSGVRKVLPSCRRLPEIADVSSDQQNSGLSSNVMIDRDTASRLGLTAQAVDSALYNAFGQRQVSTMYLHRPAQPARPWPGTDLRLAPAGRGLRDR